MGTEFLLMSSTNQYRFDNERQKSIGSVTTQIPFLIDMSFTMEINVFSLDIPFLLGLDFLDKHQLYFDNMPNYLCSPQPDIKILLTRKHGHIYLERKKNERIHYVCKDFVNLHRNFSHPGSDKLYNLMKLAKSGKQALKQKILEEITETV